MSTNTNPITRARVASLPGTPFVRSERGTAAMRAAGLQSTNIQPRRRKLVTGAGSKGGGSRKLALFALEGVRDYRDREKQEDAPKDQMEPFKDFVVTSEKALERDPDLPPCKVPLTNHPHPEAWCREQVAYWQGVGFLPVAVSRLIKLDVKEVRRFWA